MVRVILGVIIIIIIILLLLNKKKENFINIPFSDINTIPKVSGNDKIFVLYNPTNVIDVYDSWQNLYRRYNNITLSNQTIKLYLTNNNYYNLPVDKPSVIKSIYSSYSSYLSEGKGGYNMSIYNGNMDFISLERFIRL